MEEFFSFIRDAIMWSWLVFSTKTKLGIRVYKKLLLIRMYILTTNHKHIGTMYLCFGFIAGLIGTYFSVLIRLQLAAPNMNFFDGIINFIM